MDATPAPTNEDGLVTLLEIADAAERLAGVALRTPLLPFGDSGNAASGGGLRAWLKPESLQPIGAFKLRGAYNAIATLAPEQRDAGVITHSSGNHAQGVARAARLLGVRATIVMPADAPAVKVARVRADGAEIVTVGPSSDERLEVAHRLAEERGLTLVAPYDDPAVIAGQGTCGLEIVEQVAELEEVDPSEAARRSDVATARRAGAAGQAVPAVGARDARLREPALPPEAPPGGPGLTVLVPVGGGGLASGVATAVKSLCPDARVFGVEPELAADARDSLREGRIVRWDAAQVGRTIADGQRTASIGRLPFEHLRRYLDGVIAVGETEIMRAMARGAREARLVLEPSGATTLAALLFHTDELPETGRIVCVLSGGNVDPERYATLVAEGEAAGG